MLGSFEFVNVEDAGFVTVFPLNPSNELETKSSWNFVTFLIGWFTEDPDCFCVRFTVDLKAHKQIQQLLDDGYKGFSITRAGILFGRESMGR